MVMWQFRASCGHRVRAWRLSGNHSSSASPAQSRLPSLPKEGLAVQTPAAPGLYGAGRRDEAVPRPHCRIFMELRKETRKAQKLLGVTLLEADLPASQP